jgi:hypothetical protein
VYFTEFKYEGKIYRGGDKSLVRAERKQATATEDFDVHIHFIYNYNWRNISTIYIYITRIASKEIFPPSNKIHREVGRAKDLSASKLSLNNERFVETLLFKYNLFFLAKIGDPLKRNTQNLQKPMNHLLSLGVKMLPCSNSRTHNSQIWSNIFFSLLVAIYSLCV